MCGRYQFNYMAQEEDPQLSSDILSAITQHMQGEIFPSQSVFIFMEPRRELALRSPVGGFVIKISG